MVGATKGGTSSTFPSVKKKKSRWLPYLVLVALLAIWFTATWIVSLFIWSSKETSLLHSTLEVPSNNEKYKDTTKRDHVLVAEYLSGTKQGITDEKFLHLFQNVMKEVQERLEKKIRRKSLPLMAFLEKGLPPYDATRTPRLPSRAQNRPEELEVISYDDLFHSCSGSPNDFPVLIPEENNECPVQKDPFLPWIHDAFVAQGGDKVEIVAHNQRRCNTDPKQYFERLHRLEPQVTLLQSVPVKRILTDTSTKDDTSHPWERVTRVQYKLAPLEDADKDAKETRFICQFHAQLLLPTKSDDNSSPSELQKVVVGETLSVYRYNYEHANYQKKPSHPMLTRPANRADTKDSLHNEQVWNSLLHFQCPVPSHLQPLLRQVLTKNSVPTLYVDIVPIRTYPRTDKAGYFDRAARNMSASDVTFEPSVEWGPDHVLPPIAASGRWANIPLCWPFPSEATRARSSGGRDNEEHKKRVAVSANSERQEERMYRQHDLVACIWASASFTTRGSSTPDTSTSDRLLEWLSYHLNIAELDHVYVYDNSKGQQSLEPVTKLFPDSKVTRIAWKHPVCNNNRPMNANPGERSSQYAAEMSCRIRYGPTTRWMSVLDNDEYFVPQKPYNSIKQWLQDKYGDENDPTRILSFFQTRAIPNIEYMNPVPSEDKKDTNYLWKKKANATYLETYNCDRVQFPKPGWAWRAKKQIFQPKYVLHHFVHYSLVTMRLLDSPNEALPLFNNRAPLEHRVDELNEAFMLHTKTTSPEATKGWRHTCRPDKNNNKYDKDKCPVGIPFPPDAEISATNTEGLMYNCYPHERIRHEFAPTLQSLLRPLKENQDQRPSNIRANIAATAGEEAFKTSTG